MLKCGFDNGGKCAILNIDTIQNCHCPFYTQTPQYCSMCGRPLIKGGTFSNGQLYCEKCSPYLGRCETCRHDAICTFETDPSPVPKLIQQTVRQGNMNASVPVKNPARVDITCKKGCSCYNEENGCLKGVCGGCAAWE